MTDPVIVEYTVRVIARSESAADLLMLAALQDRMGAVWFRSDTPVRQLGASK